MAISFPDLEHESYYAAVADPEWGTDSRASLKAAVMRRLDEGANRIHVLAVLDEIADDLHARGMTELEDAILDVMDAMTDWAHPSKRF